MRYLKNITLLILLLIVNYPLGYARNKITVIGGTGAVGSYFVLKLLENPSNEISILGRENSQSLRQIQKNGLVIETSDGIIKIAPTKFKQITSDPYILPQQDLIIVALKQPDLTAAMAQTINSLSSLKTLIGFIGNGIPFYFLQGLQLDKRSINSVDQGGILLDSFLDHKVFHINPLIAAQIIEPGHIKINRPLDKISIVAAAVDDKAVDIDVEKIKKIFLGSHVNFSISSSRMQKIVLEKLQFSLSINTLSALMEKPIDQIFYDNPIQPFIRYCIELVNSIGEAIGIKDMKDYNQFKSIAVTKGHFSSLYKDIQNKKNTELNAIVGATLEIATYINSKKIRPSLNIKPLYTLNDLLKNKIERQQNFSTDRIIQELTAEI